MTRFLPIWWKWIAVVLVGAALAGALIWRGEKKEQAVIVNRKEPAKLLAPVTLPINAKPLAVPANAKSPEEVSLELSTVRMEERRRQLTERRETEQRLQKESAEELLSRLKTLWDAMGVGPPSSEERTLVTLALIQTLHSGDESSNAAVYQQLAALLKNDTLPLAAKLEIALILGSVQTPQSVQLLLGAYQQATDDKLRESLANGIARTGENRWAGRMREDLSPPLEDAWPLAKDDPKLAESIAYGLAKVGTAAGVQLLINEVLGSVQTVEGLADIKDIQARAAFTSLDKVRNPNAVEGLAAGLLGANSSELQRYISGMTLAAMGKIDATEVLLKWGVTASDQEAVWAEQWFGKLRDTASFDLVAAALSSTNQINFNSAAIRNAVVLGQENRTR